MSTLKQRSLIVGILLVLVTAAVYSNLLQNGFAYYDDESYITANPHLQNGLTWKSVAWAFSAVGYSDNWHPLTWLSHLLDVQLFGQNPAGHHFSNLVFHILATVLLFGFLLRTTGLLWPAAFVAALFALHPLHVESVAWAAERKDVLSAVFFFLTLLAYVHYTRRTTIVRYVVVFIVFALGLMAKPMLVTLPFILLLLDYWPLERLTVPGRSVGRLVMEKLPLVILSIVSSIITIIAQSGALGSLHQYTLPTRIANALMSYCIYIGQTFWPVNLSVFYSYPPPRPAQVAFSLVALVAITTATAWIGRKRKYLVTGWLWYVVSLVPVIGILQVGTQAHADRYTYLPLVGIFIMVAWSVQAVADSVNRYGRILIAVVLCAILAGMTIRTREQIGCWKDGITLFTHAFKVTNGQVNENAYYNFGNLMMEAGRTDEAIASYRKALEINPRHARSHCNYGLLLAEKGQSDEAIAHYLKALERGTVVEAHNNLANLLARLGRHDEARTHFLMALEKKPDYGDAHYNFGVMLADLGQTEEAAAHFREVLRINPGDSWAYFKLGVLMAEAGQPEDAILHFRTAMEHEPKNARIHNNLGLALAETGRTDEAIGCFRRALHLDPDALSPLQNLAFTYAQRGESTEAKSIVRSALASAENAGNEERIAALRRLLATLD